MPYILLSGKDAFSQTAANPLIRNWSTLISHSVQAAAGGGGGGL